MSLQDQLYDLYILDCQVRGITSRLDAATRRERLQQNKLNQLDLQRTELGEQLKLAQAKAASFEHQSSDVDQRVSRHRDQMNTVTSNKEYSALLVEVNTLKLEKSKLEDEALEQLSQVDELREHLAQVTEQSKTQARLVKGAGADVHEARELIGTKLDELTQQRDQMAQAIPSDVRNIFERLADQFDGQSLGEIEEQNRKRREYVCGGCYMQVPLERVNVLMTRLDTVVNCPSCNRILFIKQELREAIGAK